MRTLRQIFQEAKAEVARQAEWDRTADEFALGVRIGEAERQLAMLPADGPSTQRAGELLESAKRHLARAKMLRELESHQKRADDEW